MTFIAVRCPHCQRDYIVKRSKTVRIYQYYICQNTLCVRGSLRVLHVSPATVIKELKKRHLHSSR